MSSIVVPTAAQMFRDQLAIGGAGDDHRQHAVRRVGFIRQTNARTDRRNVENLDQQ